MQKEVEGRNLPGRGAGVPRRAFLASLGAAVAGASTAWAGAAGRQGREAPAAKRWSFDDFAANVRSGGPPKDGIPPIDRPKYVPAGEASKFLQAQDIVFGLEHRGVVKAYPQKVLVWHEIVNEEVDGEKLSVTYCPLTGSAVAFRGRSRVDGAPLTFGTTGNLVNSNLLMYDRQTDSHWPQILAMAITGPNKGLLLEEVPLVWTMWGRWSQSHPQTLALSTDTGFLRTYGSDPYGSYNRTGTYYDSGGAFFPVMATDQRLPAKNVVIGVKANGAHLALIKKAVARQQVANMSLSGVPLVALYDEGLVAVRVFVRRAGTTDLTFRREGGTLLDDQTRSRWSAAGRCQEGRLLGTRLAALPAYDVMWFAWYAFYPQTEVWGAAKS